MKGLPKPRHYDSTRIVADNAEAFQRKKIIGQIYARDAEGNLKCFKRGQEIVKHAYGKHYWKHPQLPKPLYVRAIGKNRYELITKL